ncbi:MAG: hypothetical protein DMG09_06915 [Acidobacteria bacterium]|nr:MAG: hypothetical protein DMG09_06915 [Acidobacteriota bacterium]
MDFTKELDVLVFADQRPIAGYRFEILRVERESGVLTIVYGIENPPKDSTVSQVLSQPFHWSGFPEQVYRSSSRNSDSTKRREGK